MTWTDKRARTLGYPELMERYFINGQFVRMVNKEESRMIRYYAVDLNCEIKYGECKFNIITEGVRA